MDVRMNDRFGYAQEISEWDSCSRYCVNWMTLRLELVWGQIRKHQPPKFMEQLPSLVFTIFKDTLDGENLRITFLPHPQWRKLSVKSMTLEFGMHPWNTTARTPPKWLEDHFSPVATLYLSGVSSRMHDFRKCKLRWINHSIWKLRFFYCQMLGVAKRVRWQYTLEDYHFEPKNGGLVQMIFLFKCRWFLGFIKLDPFDTPTHRNRVPAVSRRVTLRLCRCFGEFATFAAGNQHHTLQHSDFLLKKKPKGEGVFCWTSRGEFSFCSMIE